VLAAIDFHALGQVIWVSFVAGVGETVLFSLVIYSSGKSAEARRSGNGGALYASLAVLAIVVFAVTVVVGVAVMLNKG
jgi:hypothetical protein